MLMRLLSRLGAGLLLGTLVALADPAVEAPARPPIPSFTASLVDGSELVCQPPLSFVVIDSDVLGRLTVPWSSVVVAEPRLAGSQLFLILINGDRIVGEPIPRRFEVTSQLGKLVVTWEQIAVFAAQDFSLDSFVIHGRQAKGHLTTFVKGVPEVIGSRLRRETRQIGTSGPALSRGGPGHWLYHTGDGEEVPRILVESGCTWYPIWGTWRLLLGGNWSSFDENMAPLDPTIPWSSHWETRLDFYVVPNPAIPTQEASP